MNFTPQSITKDQKMILVEGAQNNILIVTRCLRKAFENSEGKITNPEQKKIVDVLTVVATDSHGLPNEEKIPSLDKIYSDIVDK